MTRTEVEAAFDAHKDAVYRFAWRMVPEAADDIVQDVFLRLLRGDVRFEAARGSMRGLLLGVARNLALQRLRSESRWNPIDEEQFLADPMPFDSLDIGEFVGRAVRALPPLQREVFVLAEYEELSLTVWFAWQRPQPDVTSPSDRQGEVTLADFQPDTEVRVRIVGALR